MTKTNASTATKTRAAKAAKPEAITGVPTEAAKAKARANPRKPKPGQSFPNQQEIAAPAKASPVNKDAIVQSSGTRNGDHVIVSVGGDSHSFPTALWVGDVRAACAIGESYRAAVTLVKSKPIPQPQLARGIAASDARQSAKAVQDNRAKEAARNGKATNKADAVTQKAPAAKAAPAAKEKKAAAPTGNRPYKWVGENKAREGTWRHAMLDCLSKHKDKDGAAACLKKNREFGASHVIDFRWCAAQGYIQWAD